MRATDLINLTFLLFRTHPPFMDCKRDTIYSLRPATSGPSITSFSSLPCLSIFSWRASARVIVKIDFGITTHGLRDIRPTQLVFISITTCSPYLATIHTTLTTTLQGCSKCGVSSPMVSLSMSSGELKTERVSKIFGIIYSCQEFISSICGFQSSDLKSRKDSN